LGTSAGTRPFTRPWGLRGMPEGIYAIAGPVLIAVGVVVVLNGFLFRSDVSSQHPDVLGFWLPNYCFLGKSLAAGHIPAWNPHVMGGLPFAADPQSGWMYAPAMLLFSAFPCGVAIRLMIALQPVLGGLGLYGFLRSEGLSRASATTGGLVLALGLAASRLVLFLPFPSAFAWTAVLLWLCSRAVMARTWPATIGWAGLAAVAWGQLAAAYSSHGLLLGTAVVVFYLGAKAWSQARLGTRRGRESLAIAALLAVAFVGVNLAFLLPRFAYVPETSYGQVLSDPAPLAPPLKALWPLKLATSPGGYLGMAALVLSLAAFWSRRHRALAVAFAMYGAGSYLLGVERIVPVLARAVQGVPVLEFYAHFPGRFSLGLFLALPVLAAIGLDAWIEPRPAGQRALMIVPGVLVFLVLPAAYGAGWLRLLIPGLGTVAGVVVLARLIRRPKWAAFVPALLAIELATGGLLGQTSGSFSARRAYADDLFGMGPTSWFVPLTRPNIDVDDYLRARPIVRALRNPLGRYMSLDPAEATARGYLTLQAPRYWGLMANQRAMLFALEDIQGYNPVQLERFWAYVRATSGGPLAYNASFYRRQPDGATLNLLQVHTVVASEGLASEDWHAVARDQRWIVYRLPDPSPRSSVLTQWKVVEGPEASLRAVTAPDFDPSSTVVLEEDPATWFGLLGAEGGPSSGNQQAARPQGEFLLVAASSRAVVLVRVPYARNWRAYVDGQPARILPANHFLMGIPVEPGTHRILLTYHDPWIGYGLVGSALVVLALLACGLLAWRAGAVRHSSGDRAPAVSGARSG
jgi:hypothetical protein